MTKSAAIIAMSVGKKVTHRYFSSKEWMMMVDENTYVFEDGVKISRHEFWADRSDKQWDDDWSIFN